MNRAALELSSKRFTKGGVILLVTIECNYPITLLQARLTSAVLLVPLHSQSESLVARHGKAVAFLYGQRHMLRRDPEAGQPQRWLIRSAHAQHALCR